MGLLATLHSRPWRGPIVTYMEIRWGLHQVQISGERRTWAPVIALIGCPGLA